MHHEKNPQSIALMRAQDVYRGDAMYASERLTPTVSRFSNREALLATAKMIDATQPLCLDVLHDSVGVGLDARDSENFNLRYRRSQYLHFDVLFYGNNQPQPSHRCGPSAQRARTSTSLFRNAPKLPNAIDLSA